MMNMKTDQSVASGAAIIVFVTSLICYGWFLTPHPNWNINSRVALASSLALDHRVDIERYRILTGDRACVQGKSYSDKAPGASLFALPPLSAYAYRFVIEPRNPWMVWLMTFFAVSIPAALLVTLIFNFLLKLTGDPVAALITTAAYGFGSVALPYSTMFYSHQTVALMLFAMFLLSYEQARSRATASALAFGFLSASAMISEFPAFPVCGILFFFYLWNEKHGFRRKHSSLLFMAVGAAIPLAAWLAYNRLAFGAWIDFGYRHECLPVLFEGMTRGVMGLSRPCLSTFYRVFLMPGRGLLFVTPLMLLSIPGLLLMRNRREQLAAAMTCAWIMVLISGINLCIFQPDGGAAAGPRYLLLMLPFCTIPAAVFLKNRSSGFRAAAAGVTLVSVVHMFAVTITDPHAPRGLCSILGEYTIPLLAQNFFRLGILSFISNSPFLQFGPPFLVCICASAALFVMQKGRPSFSLKISLDTFIFLLAITLFGSVSLWMNLSMAKCNAGTSHAAVGRTLYDAGRHDAAKRQFVLSIKSDNAIAPAHFGLGMIEYSQGRPIKAVKHFQDTISHDPGFSDAHFNLGMLLYQSGRFEQAITSLQKSIHTDNEDSLSRNTTASMYIAHAYLKLGRTSDALQHASQAMGMMPNNFRVVLLVSRIFRELGEFQARKDLLEAAIRRMPGCAELYVELAENELLMGNIPEARRFIDRAREIAPLTPHAKNILKAISENTN